MNVKQNQWHLTKRSKNVQRSCGKNKMAEDWEKKQNSINSNRKTENKPSGILAGLLKLFGKK